MAQLCARLYVGLIVCQGVFWFVCVLGCMLVCLCAGMYVGLFVCWDVSWFVCVLGCMLALTTDTELFSVP